MIDFILGTLIGIIIASAYAICRDYRYASLFSGALPKTTRFAYILNFLTWPWIANNIEKSMQSERTIDMFKDDNHNAQP